MSSAAALGLAPSPFFSDIISLFHIFNNFSSETLESNACARNRCAEAFVAACCSKAQLSAFIGGALPNQICPMLRRSLTVPGLACIRTVRIRFRTHAGASHADPPDP
jgi:hypothetical protein